MVYSWNSTIFGWYLKNIKTWFIFKDSWLIIKIVILFCLFGANILIFSVNIPIVSQYSWYSKIFDWYNKFLKSYCTFFCRATHVGLLNCCCTTNRKSWNIWWKSWIVGYKFGKLCNKWKIWNIHLKILDYQQ